MAPEVDEPTLWRLFAPFGAVLSVKLVRGTDPKSALAGGQPPRIGYAFVVMTAYEEACTAIAALNGSQLANKTLQVRSSLAYARRSLKNIREIPIYVY